METESVYTAQLTDSDGVQWELLSAYDWSLHETWAYLRKPGEDSCVTVLISTEDLHRWSFAYGHSTPYSTESLGVASLVLSHALAARGESFSTMAFSNSVESVLS